MSEPRLQMRRSWWAIAHLFAASLAMSAGVLKSQEALPDWGTKGKFETLMDLPADTPIMIHASVLPDGKVIFWGRDKEVDGSGETINDVVSHSRVRILDPVTGVIETVDNGTTNLFCSGHSLLPDGRLFVTGGHKHWHPRSQVGDDHTNIFDPVTRAWSTIAPTMEKGRWYPSNLTLETGEVAILSGLYQAPAQPVPIPTPPAIAAQKNPEIYNPTTNTLEVMATATNVGLPTYPYVFLDPLTSNDEILPRGVFIAGPGSSSGVSYFWNPRGGQDGKGSWSSGPSLPDLFREGSAVMYDSEQGGVLLVGGRNNAGEAINKAMTITLNQPNPQWVPIPGMAQPRSWHTTTLLPDGKVLVTGGIPCYGGQLKTPCYIKNPVFLRDTYQVDITREAEMWSPSTGWQTMATAEKTRGYHSVALLLPDATVLVGGYGYPDGLTTPPDPDPVTNPDAYLSLRRHTTGERNVEIYKPPYLFDSAGNEAPRPNITVAPTEVAYGQQFNLTYGNATAINRVSWVRLPSVTHGLNQDQRINVLSFTSGAPNQLTVTAPSDPRKCPPGYYMLFIFNSSNVPSKAKIVRISNDLPPIPSLSVDNVSQYEGNAGTTIFNFTVSLSSPAPAGGVSFDIATADGTATAASGDYVAKTLTGQTIPAGSASYTFSVAVNGDTSVEPTETFVVNVTSVTGATVTEGQGGGMILTDDVVPSLSINNVTHFEGNTGTTSFNFTVSLSSPAPVGGVSFNIATADGTATAASGDYVAKTLTGQTIPAGSTSYTFSVVVNGDTSIESTETFFVNVTNVTGATVTNGQGAGTIQYDDDPTAGIFIVGVSQLEGNTGTTIFNFTVSLTAPTGAVSFDIATADGTATAASGDYVAKTLTGQTIPAGSTSYTFSVVVNGDTSIESTETFVVNVTNVTGAAVTSSQAVGMILTDDVPSLSINDVAQVEGNTGTTSFNFTISLSSPAPAGGVSFNIATADGTATAASGDYVAKTLAGQAIPAGSTSYTFSVAVNGDTSIESTETFFVNVTNVTGATVADGQGVGTILNDDVPRLSINDAAHLEGNTGTTSFNFTVSLSAPAPAGGVSFNIATADGSATAASGDYVAKTLTGQTIPAGSTSYTFSVVVNGDTNIESDEIFVVNVTNVTGATLFDGQGVGTIQWDDDPTAGIYIVGVSQLEGNTGTTNFNFTVSLTAPTGPVSFDISTADGTATAASGDYVAKALTGQTIPAGSTSYTFSVVVKGDTSIESAETFVVSLTNVTGAAITSWQATGLILNDDAPSLSVNDVTQVEGNTGPTSFNFTVSLSSAAPAGGVAFNVATADGTATAASGDYVAKSLTGQTIPAGSSTYTFSVVVNGDASIESTETFLVNVANVSGATIADGQGQGTIINDEATSSPPNLVWVDEALPAGAVAAGDSEGWTWINSNPAPISGGLSHQSNLVSGVHQHYFSNATQALPVSGGDKLFAYVYLDPANPPLEMMLQWLEPVTGWEHRAYWGGNVIGWGSDNTVSRRYMGPMPAVGQWVKLEVPASLVGLEGRTLTGMAFTLYNGRAAWDYAGVTNTLPHTVWMDDALPAGAVPTVAADNWNWVSSNPIPASGALSHQSNVVAGVHQHYFNGATSTLPVYTGEKMVAYVYLDPANPPHEMMLQWYEPVTGWEHRAYWGWNVIGWGSDNTISRRYMGAMPPVGEWVRLEVPASLVGLEGRTLNGMAFTLYDGRAAWDYTGKAGL